jgi:exodeoxyribonuclease III
MNTSTLGILTLNVGNPSTARAERQLEWLADRPEGIFVLTETSSTGGSRLLAERLAGAGWEVRFPAPEEGERGVLVASRVRLEPRDGDLVEYLPARAEAVAVNDLDVIALYVPSRDESLVKTERKQRFLATLSQVLAARPERGAIAIGDLNILEPAHRPRYGFFKDWEYAAYDDFLDRGWVDAYRLHHPDSMDYSWVSLDNEGFRFDHVFVTHALAERVRRCDYIHETRETELTDHSALTVELIAHDVEFLTVDASLSGEPPALF